MAENETTSETLETPQYETFEDWLNVQPEDVQTRITDHISGLKNALDSERGNTKALSRQLKDMQTAAGDNEELRKQLDAMRGQLEESERRQAFLDSAAGAGCTNARAAYRLAKADADMWKSDGSPDWAAIKEAVPELFGAKQPKGNAGSGTDTNPTAGGKSPMSDWIRSLKG